MKQTKMRAAFWKKGDAFIWLSAGATAFSLLLIMGVLAIVVSGGLRFFWPSEVQRFELTDGRVLLGEVWGTEEIPPTLATFEGETRQRVRVANRRLNAGREFEWIAESQIVDHSTPSGVLYIERQEYGPFIGFVNGYSRDGEQISTSTADALTSLGEVTRQNRLDRPEGESVELKASDGRTTTLEVRDIYRIVASNDLNPAEKAGVYLSRFWSFVSEDPREANLEGGILPAIFGTVMMTLLMTVAVVPLGVMAGLYLREYAKQGRFVRAVRIAVNNLAGVPSIVFGIFGLGFFIYFMGSSIDQFFFSDALPTPTFGTSGILWSALTLALLTVPVVIVATEEGLAAVPSAVREGSLALGATKWETTWRVVLPAASPGILTGVILAISRAAGEVAPLMLTGAVKTANLLPVDATAPFVHLDRKFMHLGFHIYDLGFQSPNVEAAKPTVYMTTFLLVLLVVLLNLVAMWFRNRLWSRYRSSSF